MTLSDLAAVAPTFTAPGSTDGQVLTFQLVVHDGQLASEPAVVRVMVAAIRPSMNIAPLASIRASSENAKTGQLALKAVDGITAGPPGNNASFEWATLKEKVGAWIELTWPSPQAIDRIVLYDRPNKNDHLTAATLTFSDGSTMSVRSLPNDGAPASLNIMLRGVTSVRLTVSAVGEKTSNIGLAEFEVFTTVLR